MLKTRVNALGGAAARRRARSAPQALRARGGLSALRAQRKALRAESSLELNGEVVNVLWDDHYALVTLGDGGSAGSGHVNIGEGDADVTGLALADKGDGVAAAAGFQGVNHIALEVGDFGLSLSPVLQLTQQELGAHVVLILWLVINRTHGQQGVLTDINRHRHKAVGLVVVAVAVLDLVGD